VTKAAWNCGNRDVECWLLMGARAGGDRVACERSGWGTGGVGGTGRGSVRASEVGNDGRPVDLAGRLGHGQASEDRVTCPIVTRPGDGLKTGSTGRLARTVLHEPAQAVWQAGRPADLRVRDVQQEDLPHAVRFPGGPRSVPQGVTGGVPLRDRDPNENYLTPQYLDVLASHNVAHAFNAWTRMPALDEQAQIPEAFTADFTVARALLRKGRPYDKAVETFEPYDRIQEPNPGARDGMRMIAQRAMHERKNAFLFVNNRLEENAPSTIEAVVDLIETSSKATSASQ
jgi:hypothetical protein